MSTEFRRKDDYSEKVLALIKELLKEHEDLLFIPNKGEIKCYYRGITVIERLTDSTIKLSKASGFSNDIKGKGSWEEKADYLTGIIKCIKKNMVNKMPRDVERKSSQRIALKNVSYKPNEYSICGWECTIPKKDINGLGKNDKTPEVDMVMICPEKRIILYTEYKCRGSSLLKGNQNIEGHFEDYTRIVKSKHCKDFNRELLKAYNLMSYIYGGKTTIPDKDFEKYKAKVAFLFVDKVVLSETQRAKITESDYSKAMCMIKEKKGIDEVEYMKATSDENLKLSPRLWKRLKELIDKYTFEERANI